MKRALILVFAFIFLSYNVESQNFEYEGGEIGVDLDFSASTNGGNFGIGGKYGFTFGEYLIVGPSARYSRLWWKNTLIGQQGGYNVWGGGAFVHARFFNALFLGAEFEMLKTPFAKTTSTTTGGGVISGTGSWAPTLFLGGGFSMEFNEAVRINAGIMYDVINAQNSPFQQSYKTITTSQGIMKRIPLIYRISFFFPLGNG